MQYKGFKMMRRVAAVIVSAAIMLTDLQGVSAAGVEQTVAAETTEAETSDDSAQTGTDEGLPAEDSDAEMQTDVPAETVQTAADDAAQAEITETETTQVEKTELQQETTDEKQTQAQEVKTEEANQVTSEVQSVTDASEIAVDDEAVKSDGDAIQFQYYSEDNKKLITEAVLPISVNDPVTIAAVFGEEMLPAGATGASVNWSTSNSSYVKVTERPDIVGVNAATIEGLKPTTDLKNDSNNGIVSISCVLTYRDSSNTLVMRSGILNVRVKPLAESISIKVENSAGKGTVATGKIAVYDIASNEFIAVDNRKLDPSDTPIEYLSVSVYPLDANPKVTWTSSNTSIMQFVESEDCEVTDNGAKAIGRSVKVASSGAGEAIITATSMDGSKVVGTVTVRPRRVITELSFNPKSIDKDGEVFYDEKNRIVKMAEGTSIYLEPRYTPLDATVKKVSWSSSNSSVLDMSVNESTNVLKITAKDGTGDTKVTLTATATDMSEKSWDVTVDIRPRVKKIEIYREEDKYYENCLNGKSIGVDPENVSRTFKLAAKSYPEDAILQVQWKVSDEKIASCKPSADDPNVCEITVNPDVKGTAVITATAIDGSKTVAATTLNVATLATKVRVEGSKMVMKGKTIKLTAIVEPQSIANIKVKWKSLMPDVASVNENTGDVIGKKQGIAIIIATAADGSGVSSEAYPIQVTDMPEKFDIVDADSEVKNNIISGKTIGIDPDLLKSTEGGLAAENTRKIAMKILPDTACQEVEWKSSNEKIATVKTASDGSATITAKAIGRTTITAKAIDGSGKTASIVVNVNTLARNMTITGGHYLARDMTLQLKAEITNKDAASKSVIWKSSAPKIAEVDETGLVTAVGKDGTAVITAEAIDGSGVSATHNIHVVNGKSKVEIVSSDNQYPLITDKKKKTMNIDLSGRKTIEVTLRAELSGYTKRNDPFDIKWSTSSKSVAEVETDKDNPEIGHVTIYKGGTVKITATSAEGYASNDTVTITVKNDNPWVTITGPGHRLAQGKKMKLSTGGVPVTWESSNESVAQVNNKGQVTADRYDSGSATITAKAVDGTFSDSWEIVVGDPVQYIDLTLNNIRIEDTKKKIGVDVVNGCDYNSYKGSEITLGAILNFEEDLSQAGGSNVTWKSSNKNVATIDENGKVELKKKGNVTFTATATDGTNKRAKVTFVVSKQVERMYPVGGSENVAKEVHVGLKKSIQLSSEIEYRPLAATKPKLEWTIVDEDSDAISVGKNNGKVTGKIEDESVRIRATDVNNKEVYCEFIVVVDLPVNKVEIVESGESYRDVVGIDLSLPGDKQRQLTANLYAKDDEGIPTLGYNVKTNVIWSSSNKAIASVDENGLVTAHKNGEVTITATATDGSKKKGKIKVCCGKLVNAIELSETIENGIELDLAKKNKRVIDLANKITVKPVTAMNRKLTYTSTDKTVVTVSSNGKVTAKGEGPADIIVTSKDGGCSRTIPVVVYDTSYSE